MERNNLIFSFASPTDTDLRVWKEVIRDVEKAKTIALNYLKDTVTTAKAAGTGGGASYNTKKDAASKTAEEVTAVKLTAPVEVSTIEAVVREKAVMQDAVKEELLMKLSQGKIPGKLP